MKHIILDPSTEERVMELLQHVEDRRIVFLVADMAVEDEVEAQMLAELAEQDDEGERQ